jgi:hypothetical protein
MVAGPAVNKAMWRAASAPDERNIEIDSNFVDRIEMRKKRQAQVIGDVNDSNIQPLPAQADPASGLL